MSWCYFCFFFNDTATTEIYTLSLHDALPICAWGCPLGNPASRSTRGITKAAVLPVPVWAQPITSRDRKSTRLNSSHANISYAVFCLKKKKYHHCSCIVIFNTYMIILVTTPSV